MRLLKQTSATDSSKTNDGSGKICMLVKIHVHVHAYIHTVHVFCILARGCFIWESVGRHMF